MFFRGREITHAERGKEVVRSLIVYVEDLVRHVRNVERVTRVYKGICHSRAFFTSYSQQRSQKSANGSEESKSSERMQKKLQNRCRKHGIERNRN